MMRSLPLVTVCLAAALAACQTRPVTDCREAETAVVSLPSWPAVYSAFRRHAQCDDGAIAAGFSDQIVRLLSESWNTLHQAQEIFHADPAFERFVVRHVDPSADPSANNSFKPTPLRGAA
jgi:hypothetical protein